MYVCEFHSYLVLPLAGRVVQVVVTPVVFEPLFRLLVHPVQLVGAALHVVSQAQQVALSSAGVSLAEGTGSLESPTVALFQVFTRPS